MSLHSDATSTGGKPVDSDAADTRPAPVLIDTHAHLYDCYDRAAYFDATLANIRDARRRLGIADANEDATHTPACLLLAEPGNLQLFQALLDRGEVDGGRWRFVPCGDGLSLIAQHRGRDELIFIKGRQIRTRERLEVLALCCDAMIPNDVTTVEALNRSLESDGLPVLPIGAGKWLGRRGRFVDELMDGPLGERFWLGDNAGRFAAGPTPRQFLQAQARGRWVLPGSGTVAFASQATRIGRYGILLDVALNRDAPAASIKQRFRAGGEQPVTFGRPDGLVNYLRCQTLMQLYNFLYGPDWYGTQAP